MLGLNLMYLSAEFLIYESLSLFYMVYLMSHKMLFEEGLVSQMCIFQLKNIIERQN